MVLLIREFIFAVRYVGMIYFSTALWYDRRLYVPASIIATQCLALLVFI